MVDNILFCPDCEGEGINERGYICKKCRGTGLVRVYINEEEVNNEVS
jgi:DnaJ-class molecular chaperone